MNNKDNADSLIDLPRNQPSN